MTVLSAVALVAVAVAAAAHVRVHLLPTGRNPVRDAVSDYGAGPYRAWYRTTVVGLAIASGSLTVAFARDGGPGAGSLAALAVFAVARLAIAWFPVDLPGEPATRPAASTICSPWQRSRRSPWRRRRFPTG